MNNNFEWNRFCRIVEKDFRNIWPMFGKTMLILAAVPIFIWLPCIVFGVDSCTPIIRLAFVQAAAMLTAIMAASRLYRTWNITGDGIYYAMLPASKLEKFLSALLHIIIISPLMVYIGGLAIDTILAILPGPFNNKFSWQSEVGFPFIGIMDFNKLGFEDVIDPNNVSSTLGLYYAHFIISYIGSVMLFVFTSTIFRKHKVINTFLWLMLINFAFSLISFPFGISYGSDMAHWVLEHFENNDPQHVFNTILATSLAINTIITALFTYLSYRRLKQMPY